MIPSAFRGPVYSEGSPFRKTFKVLRTPSSKEEQLRKKVKLTDILEHRVLGTGRARQHSSLWRV
jgi:hypothetical protein